MSDLRRVMFLKFEVVLLHDFHLFGLGDHYLDLLVLSLLLVFVAFSNTVRKFGIQRLNTNWVKQFRIFKKICVCKKGAIHFRIIRMLRVVLSNILEKLFLGLVSLLFFVHFSIQFFLLPRLFQLRANFVLILNLVEYFLLEDIVLVGGVVLFDTQNPIFKLGRILGLPLCD